MTAPDYLAMDPHILYSLANMKLRNDFEDLPALARALEVDRAALERRLAEAGFRYHPDGNRFRAARSNAGSTRDLAGVVVATRGD